jgi:hypothetical protein
MPEGPWLPEGTEEFAAPGTFNRIYAEWLENYPQEAARIERLAEENTATLKAELETEG